MYKKNSGFTIVELLIVIVVVGILAAITIVAYNGIQQRARTAQITSAVDQWEKIIRMEMTLQDDGTLPDGSTCLGNSAADFPAAGAGMIAGTCFTTDGVSGSSYDSTVFNTWKTTDRPNGLLPQTKLILLGKEMNSRGIGMHVSGDGSQILLEWIPQTKEECGRGQAFSTFYNDSMPLPYAEGCLLVITP